MREIKFRGWNSNTKTMVDLLKITPFALSAGFSGKGLFLPFMDNVELMQYTGLKDKNGKEIYKGDILKYGNTVAFVVWCLDRWRFNSYMEKGTLDLYPYVEPFGDKRAEVIGNIYENPELLNNEQEVKVSDTTKMPKDQKPD